MSNFGIMQTFHSWYGIAIMGILGSLSIFLFALVLVRWNFFRRIKVNSRKLMEEVHSALKNNDTNVLTQLRGQRSTDPPVKQLISAGLSNPHFNPSEMTELFYVTRIQQRERLTKDLSKFGTMAAIAPFLGLLGTVMGIIESFNNLAQTGAAGPTVVASGVASALWTTAAGLIVAIPAVVAYNFFKGKAKKFMTEMEVAARELLIIFKTEKIPTLKSVKGGGV